MFSNPFIQNILRGIKNQLQRPQKKGLRQLGLGWFQVKFLKHLPAGQIRSIRLFGQAFYFEAPQELLHGLQEIFVDEVYKQSLAPGARIIDCGANIGLSVLYIKKQCPSATIIAFEPDPANFSLLEKNIASFQLTGVQVEKAAIWKEYTTLSFTAQQGMASSLTTQAAPQTLQVKTVRLHDYLNEPVHFLKLDIEGAEWDVLTDCASNLSKVKNIFVEYHGSYSAPQKLTDILTILQAAGFCYYIKEAASLQRHPYQQKNNQHPYDLQLNIFGFRNE
jgi:FkbM family methyltransferase